ncbi:MAG: hypothetical protein IJ313_09385 [Clostridia bacterium]|nr:hypothetical protein [Clostridia bacterium]
MLRKLMKHELRATGRVMGPMLLLTLIAAMGGNIAVHNLLEADSALLSVLGSFMLTAFIATLAAVFIVSFVLMIQRFYKNLLRDEGYLMMTLPVTVHEHVLSKLIVSIIWAAAAAVTTMLAMGILVFELEFVDLIFYDLEGLFAQLEFSGLRLMDYAGHAVLFVLEMILMMILATACLCLQLYAAMAVGHSFTHHKGLISVAAYFGLSIVWSCLQNGALYLLRLMAPQGINLGLENLSPFAATHIMLWGMILIILISTAIWYAITTYFLKNRLNIG